jgi:hypothetical protein
MWFWGASPSEKLFDFLRSVYQFDAFFAKLNKATLNAEFAFISKLKQEVAFAFYS